MFWLVQIDEVTGQVENFVSNSVQPPGDENIPARARFRLLRLANPGVDITRDHVLLETQDGVLVTLNPRPSLPPPPDPRAALKAEYLAAGTLDVKVQVLAKAAGLVPLA